MKKENAVGVHTGHRDRMRKRFLSTDGGGIADHELLEMLLYYAIPRRDTNDLAHRLIEEFGSFAGVLEADTDLLCRVGNISRTFCVYRTYLFDIFFILGYIHRSPCRAVYDSIGTHVAYKRSNSLSVSYIKLGNINAHSLVSASLELAYNVEAKLSAHTRYKYLHLFAVSVHFFVVVLIFA